MQYAANLLPARTSHALPVLSAVVFIPWAVPCLAHNPASKLSASKVLGLCLSVSAARICLSVSASRAAMSLAQATKSAFAHMPAGPVGTGGDANEAAAGPAGGLRAQGVGQGWAPLHVTHLPYHLHEIYCTSAVGAFNTHEGNHRYLLSYYRRLSASKVPGLCLPVSASWKQLRHLRKPPSPPSPTCLQVWWAQAVTPTRLQRGLPVG